MVDADNWIPPLRTVYLYLTGSCNLKCRHCWIDPAYASKTKAYLPWSVWEGIFEQALDMGLKNVKITGGEPFLHPEICDILLALKEMNLSISVETNGTLIGKKEAALLKEVNARSSISIDGPTASVHDYLRGVEGSFEQVLRGARYLKELSNGFQIITCLYRKNIDQLSDTISLAKKLGANSLKINPITGMSRADKMKRDGDLLGISELLHVEEWLRSNRNGWNVFLDVPPAFRSLKDIRKNGFSTCGILDILGMLNNGRAGLCGIGEIVEDLDFGNLLEMGVKQIWEKNTTLRSIRENIPNNLKGVCSNCIFKQYCLGKCVAKTYYEQKDLFKGFSFCEEALAKGLFPGSRLAHREKETVAKQ